MSDSNNPGPGPEDPHPQPYGQSPSYGQEQQPYGAPPAYGQEQQAYGAPPAYGQGQPGTQPYGGAGTMAPAQEQTWASAAHWSALVAGVVTSGVFAFAGPLLVMLIKGNESPRVRRNAVESLNFQISMLIYGIVSVVLWLVLIGFLLSIVVGVTWLVCTILAAVKATNGEDYRYPLTLRLVS